VRAPRALQAWHSLRRKPTIITLVKTSMGNSFGAARFRSHRTQASTLKNTSYRGCLWNLFNLLSAYSSSAADSGGLVAMMEMRHAFSM